MREATSCGRSHHLRDLWRFAERANDFVVIPVSDQDQRVPFLGKLHGFHVDLGDQRTSGVNHAQIAVHARLADFRRNPVSAVNNALSGRDFFHTIDENGAFFLQFFHHEPVVDNLFPHINRRPKGFESDPDDINRPHYARAEASRF